MDLKSKLVRLKMPSGSRGGGDAVEAPRQGVEEQRDSDSNERVLDLRRRIQGIMTRKGERRPRRLRPLGAGDLPGELLQTEHGPLQLCRRHYPLTHYHGRLPLSASLDLAPADLAQLALDERLAGVHLREVLFLDTETTGLAGGTGTLPFLVGLAWYGDGELVVEQLLLRQPGQEGPLLAFLTDKLASASALVTFNGKTFDWPLLCSRFVLNRMPAPAIVHHVDLLHCARRVFKFRLEQVRLANLEREVLGFSREDDIAGHEIPATYFAYLRGAPGSLLTPVVEHNALDLVSLAALLGHFGASYSCEGADRDPRDRLGLAHLAARAGDAARAEAYALLAAEHKSGRASAAALMLAGDVARKRGDFVGAAVFFERALEEAAGEAEQACIHLKLAKLYEHRLRAVDKATLHARGTLAAEGQKAHQRRLARLQRRASRRS